MISSRNLDVAEFYKKASSPEIEAKIDQDMKLAQELDVRGTPTVFIDGHKVSASMAQVEEVISYLRRK